MKPARAQERNRDTETEMREKIQKPKGREKERKVGRN